MGHYWITAHPYKHCAAGCPENLYRALKADKNTNTKTVYELCQHQL